MITAFGLNHLFPSPSNIGHHKTVKLHTHVIDIPHDLHEIRGHRFEAARGIRKQRARNELDGFSIPVMRRRTRIPRWRKWASVSGVILTPGCDSRTNHSYFHPLPVEGRRPMIAFLITRDFSIYVSQWISRNPQMASHVQRSLDTNYDIYPQLASLDFWP